MPLLRGRRDDDPGTKYQMREKVFAIGDDYWIETDGGERVFKVNGKALRVRHTFVLEAPGGEELFTIQEKKLSVRDKMAVERDEKTVATVKKALVAPLRDRFTSTSSPAKTSRQKATSSTTSTRSSAAATKWPKSRRSGSACGTPTASRSHPTRTMR